MYQMPKFSEPQRVGFLDLMISKIQTERLLVGRMFNGYEDEFDGPLYDEVSTQNLRTLIKLRDGVISE